MLICKIC